MMNPIVPEFANLFMGRTDAYGAVHGQCIKAPLTLDHWQEHLFGHGSVGVYPLVGLGPEDDFEFVVHWGCVDIDDGPENITPAVNLWRALKALGITSWVERTKGKGFHVWVFAEEWVPAVTMRAALIVACQVADYRPKEINPKQVKLAPGQLGNYVNAPYAKQWADEGRRVVLDGGSPRGWLTLSDFVAVAHSSRTSTQTLEAAASLYKAPERRSVALGDIDWDRDLAPLTRRLSGLTFTLFRDGPLPNRETGHIDRSAGLARLAHLCRKDGLSATEALLLVGDLDVRLGKYVDRADRELQLTRIVEKAYG